MNPDTVKREMKKGEPIFYGDATNVDTLNNVAIGDAKLVVVAISDILATSNATKTISALNNSVYLIVRTPFLSEVPILKDCGANEIIPAEFETSIEILVRALTRFLIPANEINKIVENLRSDNYKMLRQLDSNQLSFNELNINLPDIDIVSYKLSDKWPYLNKTIGEINFRNLFSLTIIAIMRGEKQIINPGANEFLYEEDVIILMGPKDKVQNFIKNS
jgi:CPA2 family monovalent cation:H+ antiporter-2